MKTLIDPDFEITDKLRAWAEQKVPQIDIDAETEKFVDYWLAHGKKMACWDATWRNWMRRSPEMGGVMKPRGQHKVETISEEQRQEDIRKWHDDMKRFKVVRGS